MHGGCGGMWSEVAAHALQLRSFLSNFGKTMRAKIFISMLALLMALGAAAPAAAVEKSVLQQLQQKVLRDYKSEIVRRASLDGKSEEEYFSRIPAGSFHMGDISGGGDSDEQPVHRVSVKAFLLGKTEVTFAQWDACVEAGGCSHKPSDEGWGRGKRPVMNVLRKDIIKQFIPWLNKTTGKRYRLPTEAEWEYAARAGSEMNYFFGNSISDLCHYANGAANETVLLWRNQDCRDAYEGTAPVASFAANSFGLYDMHGNVMERPQDCWNDSYQGAPSDGSAWLAGGCSERILLRGGSWASSPDKLRSANRSWLLLDGRYDDIGFRLARTLD